MSENQDMKSSFAEYVQMREANIVQQNSVGQVAKSVGQAAIGAVSGVLGIDSIIKAAGLAGQIFNLIKNRQDARNLIQQAMSLPDASRGSVAHAEIFDIDDSLWDAKTGLLSAAAKAEILKIVQSRIQQIASNPQSVNPDSLKGFANNIAIEFLRNKLQATQKV